MEVKKGYTKKTILSLTICFGISLMIFSALFDRISPNILGYSDEFFALFCLFEFLLYSFIKKAKIKAYFLLIASLLFIGLAGNLISNIQTSIYVVLLDVFIFFKPYIILISIYTILNSSETKLVYSFMVFLSKLLLWILAFFSLLTIFVDLGMNNANGEFFFLDSQRFTGTVSLWTIIFFAVIYSNPKNKRFMYFLLSALIVFRSGSGMGSLAILLVVLVYLFLERQTKIKMRYIIIAIPICLWVAREEIEGYLLDIDAARFQLFYYGFITANRYFPFGAGFATYGSSTAADYYSKLYLEYGFDSKWGLSKESPYFLTDSYYPQIIGQFGYIGLIIYLVFIYKIIKNMLFNIRNKYMRCAALFLFACWLISGLGFGMSGSWGSVLCLVVSIFALNGIDKDLQQIIVK